VFAASAVAWTLCVLSAPEAQGDDIILIDAISRDAKNLIGTERYHARINHENLSLLSVSRCRETAR